MPPLAQLSTSGAASTTRPVLDNRTRQRARRTWGAGLHLATLRPEDTSTSSSNGPDGLDAAALWQAVAATAAVSSIAANVGAARAADAGDWKPRRHHRHIGERYTANWASAVVQGEEQDKEMIKQLQKQLQQEKKRATDEATRRAAAETKVRQLQMQQSLQRTDAAPAYSVRIAGAEVGGIMAWLLVLGGGWALYQNRDTLLGGGRGGRKGRWVYDRGLGGRKVWVPYDQPAPASAPLPSRMSDSDFAELTSVATSARTGGTASPDTSGRQEAPDWWRPPSAPYAPDSVKAEMQAGANRLIAKLAASKNSGQDFELADILALRAACKEGGGLTVESRTIGGRDAIYRALVEACVKSCAEPGSVDLGGEAPLVLAAGLANDLKIPDVRAAKMLQGWVAAAFRSRIVEAIAGTRDNDEPRVFMALLKLAALTEGLPVLTPESAEAELIAGELDKWASVDIRKKVFVMYAQIDPDNAPLVARMLGFDPAMVIPQLQAELAAAGSDNTPLPEG